MKKKLMSLILMCAFALLIIAPAKAEAATIKISKAKATMEVDSTLTLKVNGTESTPTWTSSKKSVATVTKKGYVTAKSEGKATITATVNKKKYKCVVTVVDSNKVAATPTATPTPTPIAKSSLGSRKNPYSAYDENKINYYDFSDGEQTIKIKLVEVIDGTEANNIIAKENMFNELPSSNNRWVLYKFSIEYVKGNGELQASDIINSNILYNEDSTKALSNIETASFSDMYSGLGIYDVSLYEGGKSDVYMAILVDNSVSYATFKISWYNKNFTSQELWFTTKH